MNTYIYKSKQGFVALISALIISAILLTLVVTVGFASWFARADVLSSGQVDSARAKAQGCTDVALHLLGVSPNPTVFLLATTNVAIDATHSCTINSITPTSTGAIIMTSARESSATVHLRTQLSVSPSLQVISSDSF